MTFEEYLRSAKTTDLVLHVRVTSDSVTFYIHPHGADGETPDYEVRGNELTYLNKQSTG